MAKLNYMYITGVRGVGGLPLIIAMTRSNLILSMSSFNERMDKLLFNVDPLCKFARLGV